MNLPAIQCNRCLEWIVPTGAAQKYCQECAKKVNSERANKIRKEKQQAYRHKRIQDTLDKVFELRLKQTQQHMINCEHHCERCGYLLDNGHEYGPFGDYTYLCQTCERDLMRQDPNYPLMRDSEIKHNTKHTENWSIV